jgi:hypothetical protein
MKETFASKTFASKTFASGHWGGLGVTSATLTPDGLDYAAADGRPHYLAGDRRPHYRADDNRPHYEVS